MFFVARYSTFERKSGFGDMFMKLILQLLQFGSLTKKLFGCQFTLCRDRYHPDMYMGRFFVLMNHRINDVFFSVSFLKKLQTFFKISFFLFRIQAVKKAL